MNREVITLVKAYREELDVEKRVEIATRIYHAIESDLRLYIFGKIYGTDAEDVLSETFKAIFTGLSNFVGFTDTQFYAWLYQIARYKIIDHVRKKNLNARYMPMPIEEIENMIEDSQKHIP